ncbi:MAG: pilus assembly protein [Verrucomicrobiae bacterium]|nr:pilus assembly protein [Verrucomicrobiae bacterium]
MQTVTQRRKYLVRRGQALVEFAIGLTVLLLLVFGVVDLGRAVFAYNSIAHCAREGTRYAIVHGSQSTAPVGPAANDPTLESWVRRFATGLQAARLTVTSTWRNASGVASNDPGSIVTVVVGYNFQPATLFFLPLSLRSQSSGMIVN